MATKRKPAAKKPATKRAAKKSVARKPKADVSKMDKAREVFAEAQKTALPRKEVIELFIKEAGLTKAGAGTYYQMLKNQK